VSGVASRSGARCGGSLGHDVEGVQVLETLEFDGGVELGVDAGVGCAVRGGTHVGREGGAVLPAGDHHELGAVAVGLPDLQVDEARGGVDEVGAAAERRDELGRALGWNAQARHGDVHRMILSGLRHKSRRCREGRTCAAVTAGRERSA
jgi:hypothetical protein